MPDAHREKIFTALENVLKGVQGIGDVRRGKIDPLSINNYPAAFVLPGGDTVVEFIGNKILRELTAFTFLWIRTQENIHITLEAILPKVQQALAADHTLGGLTIDVTEVSVHEPFPLNELESEAGVVLEHLVRYRVLREDPFIQA